jgi:preprotein translocase subunit SecF
MSLDDTFGKDSSDPPFDESWAFRQIVARAISQAFTRLGLAMITSALVVAAALLSASPSESKYAAVALGAALVFGAWFATSVVVATLRGR